MGKHTRRSQPPSAPIPSALSPPKSSSPTTPVPPTTSAHSPQPSSPRSPSLTNVQLEEDNTFNNSDSQPKPKRKKQDMTQLKGLRIQGNSNAKIEVVFNEKGQPIGDASIPFASFIGALARNKVPITVDDWRDVSSTHKKNLRTLVLKQENLGEEVTRAMLWINGHLNKNGNPTNKVVEDSIKKIQQFNELQSKTTNQSVKDDALSHVLGADRPGRLKGLGFGVTSSKLKAQSHSSTLVRSLEEKLRALKAKVDLLNESGQNSVDARQNESDARKSNH